VFAVTAREEARVRETHTTWRTIEFETSSLAAPDSANWPSSLWITVLKLYKAIACSAIHVIKESTIESEHMAWKEALSETLPVALLNKVKGPLPR